MSWTINPTICCPSYCDKPHSAMDNQPTRFCPPYCDEPHNAMDIHRNVSLGTWSWFIDKSMIHLNFSLDILWGWLSMALWGSYQYDGWHLVGLNVHSIMGFITVWWTTPCTLIVHGTMGFITVWWTTACGVDCPGHYGVHSSMMEDTLWGWIIPPWRRWCKLHKGQNKYIAQFVSILWK